MVIDRISTEKKHLSRIAEDFKSAFEIGHGVAFFFHPDSPPAYFSSIPACVPCDYYQQQELQPRMFSFNHYLGACPSCDGLGFHRIDREPCLECDGKRLKPEYLAVTMGGQSISKFCSQNVSEASNFLDHIKLSKSQTNIGKEAIKEILHRLDFLNNVGLEYLSLDRRGNTLAGGEAQRIRLATQIGNRLVGVIYVLDEPTIGLHPRDTARLVRTLRELVNLGNTVVMVEHDPLCIANADHVIDMGPGAGHLGGEVIAAASPAQLMRKKCSATGRYLAGKMRVSIPRSREVAAKWLKVRGAKLHNLKNIDVCFPLQRFSVVSGVSGSGKSTLVVDILQNALASHFAAGKKKITGKGFARITGAEELMRMAIVDQSPLARTPSSNLATYCDIFTAIREFFAALPGSKARGFPPGIFSFNRPGGRCEVCEGRGLIEIPMHFLSDVWINCQACRGSRYLEEVLAVRYKGKNIAQVLGMDVAQGCEFFSAHRKIVQKLEILRDIGLGYVKLGQPTTTFSGGEAQRLKLAKELAMPDKNTLYIMDEPTTGLHPLDIQKLLEVIHRLIGEGNTAIAIEHNLDVIRCADWLVDLGPEGGEGGGEVLCAGTVEKIANCPASHTGKFLRKIP